MASPSNAPPSSNPQQQPLSNISNRVLAPAADALSAVAAAAKSQVDQLIHGSQGAAERGDHGHCPMLNAHSTTGEGAPSPSIENENLQNVLHGHTSDYEESSVKKGAEQVTLTPRQMELVKASGKCTSCPHSHHDTLPRAVIWRCRPLAGTHCDAFCHASL